MNSLNSRDAIFGIMVKDRLLYQTLRSNPKKTLRFYDRMGRPGEVDAVLIQVSMRRLRKAGDVRGLTLESIRRKEPYIGPMR